MEPNISLSTSSTKQPKNLIGPAIRRIRLAQRTPITQQDLSARLATRGVTLDQSAIARIECGERGVSDIEAVAIAKALRVPIEKLFTNK